LCEIMDREGEDGDGRRMVRDFIPRVAAKQILIVPVMEDTKWITYSKKQRKGGSPKTDAILYFGAQIADRQQEKDYLQLRGNNTWSRGNRTEENRSQLIRHYVEGLDTLRTMTQTYAVRNKLQTVGVDWTEEERLSIPVNPVFLENPGDGLEGRMELCAALVEMAAEE